VAIATAVALAVLLALPAAAQAEGPLVLQSDFGTRDGAVAAMKGVATSVSAEVVIHDLTHEIPPYDIWEGALRLAQAAPYWPEGTVFVSVVDPGVGTERRSIVMRSRSGHYFVTPDNGTLTFVAEELGIDAVREIDEAVNRRAGSEESYTFHGRDVYVYTGARLAAGIITFEEVGRELPDRVVTIPYERAAYADGVLRGNIPILDVRYGNVWTNIDRATFRRLGLRTGERARVRIRQDGDVVYEGVVPYQATFGDVEVGQPLLYLNSLGDVALAINQGSFAEEHGVGSGAGWSIEIRKEHERSSGAGNRRGGRIAGPGVR
jgi:S-adenosylmethionine hydrolase